MATLELPMSNRSMRFFMRTRISSRSTGFFLMIGSLAAAASRRACPCEAASASGGIIK